MSTDASVQARHPLSQFVISKTSLSETLLRVSQVTTEALPAADMAGISLLGEQGQPTTGVFTDPDAPDIDQAHPPSCRPTTPSTCCAEPRSGRTSSCGRSPRGSLLRGPTLRP